MTFCRKLFDEGRAVKSKFQILLADDDEVNQEIVREFLGASDLELTVASDGREALEIALLRTFDLMIVDQNMPFITGDRVIRHLRAGRSLNAATPVIRFTADANFTPLDYKACAGKNDVTLPKPLTRDAMVSTIRAMLGAGPVTPG